MLSSSGDMSRRIGFEAAGEDFMPPLLTAANAAAPGAVVRGAGVPPIVNVHINIYRTVSKTFSKVQ